LKVPEISLRTTVIVGYPNEGDKEFEELLQFVKETEFDRLGVFTYSQEEGTASFPLGDPIQKDIKEERLNIIMEAQREIAIRKNQQLVGKTIRVLVDRMEGNAAIARTESDAPEVDDEVTINGADILQTGNFYNVEIVDADAYDLFAEPLENHVPASVRMG